ncbi:unnamed protein product [Diatraea saccharalis]|uniref:HAT C-terminal dimerisation domain-containing protein n=1 Tax=Diatraea saccharalis TaxID=40085 RepID=A0A9N9QL45_9NEOP|nr:unnamed protein product [Diatraea saccharalis]
MPKPQYIQKFRDSWLRDPDLKDWLQVIESTGGQTAKCKFCGTLLRNHYGDLKNHGLSKKHQQNSKIVTTQPKLPFKPESMGKKKEEDMPMLHECDANGIIAAIKTTLTKFSIPLQNLVGIGTDNASVMTGVNNGVHAKLKEELPNLVLVRCVCHSLQLAVSAATKQFLPRNLEFLIKETYDWFSRSSARQIAYKELYNVINDGHDPLKIVQACQTSVEHALSHNKEPIAQLMLHFAKKPEEIAKVDEQWRQIHLLTWENTKNTKEFWYEVMESKDMAGENRFKDLATFALNLLVLPHSNADVERLFSTMNVVKTKQRNRMKLELLSSIMTVRAGLSREGKCCNNYIIPHSVIQKIGTKEIYSSQIENTDEADSSEDELL